MDLPPVVSRFLAAISELDADAAADCFSRDAPYAYAVPHPPVVGRQAIRAMLAGVLDKADRAPWGVTTATCRGGLICVERVDRFWFDGREVAIECAGVIEVAEDEIVAMRNYVDLQTWQSRRGAA